MKIAFIVVITSFGQVCIKSRSSVHNHREEDYNFSRRTLILTETCWYKKQNCRRNSYIGFIPVGKKKHNTLMSFLLALFLWVNIFCALIKSTAQIYWQSYILLQFSFKRAILLSNARSHIPFFTRKRSAQKSSMKIFFSDLNVYGAQSQ